MTDPHNLLIIRLSSLGDIIHTLPAFQSLRATFAEARIDWLVERRMAFLLSAVEGIDEVLPIDTRALRSHFTRREAWRQFWEPMRKVRARRYDVAMDFQGLLKTAILGLMSGARTRMGFSQALVREKPAHWFYHRTVKRPALPLHVAHLNLLLAKEAGARAGELCVKLQATATDRRAIEDLLRRERLTDFIVINPGGGWPTKLWGPARYGNLAAKIENELNIRVAVTTGPGEEHLYRQIAENCIDHPPVHIRVSFLQLIPLLQRARLMIAGDTGPLHLACALGTPVVGIMGPTSPVRNGPWSGNDEIVMRQLPCSFCNRRACPTSIECMDIEVEEVFTAAVRRLERAP